MHEQMQRVCKRLPSVACLCSFADEELEDAAAHIRRQNSPTSCETIMQGRRVRYSHHAKTTCKDGGSFTHTHTRALHTLI
jgi:hypothetical protein